MDTAIIVAGGSGSRVGGGTPKQFLEVGANLNHLSVCSSLRHRLPLMAQNLNYLSVCSSLRHRLRMKGLEPPRPLDTRF